MCDNDDNLMQYTRLVQHDRSFRINQFVYSLAMHMDTKYLSCLNNNL